MTKCLLFLTLCLITLPAVAWENENEAGEVGVHSHASAHIRRPSPGWNVALPTGEPFSNLETQGRAHVLIFHFGGDCLHCAEQIQGFSKHAAEFEKVGASLFAISTDHPDQLKRSIKEFGEPLSIQMLADPDLNSFKAFRAFDLFNNQPLHATVFVDSQGQVRWQNIGRHPFVNCELLLSEIENTIQDDEKIVRPRVFLDKSPRIVAYQLGRLSNDKLLLVERATTDKKFIPVFDAILKRDGMSPKYREEAIAALVSLNASNPVVELLEAIEGTKTDTRQGLQTARELSLMLLNQPAEPLKKQSAAFIEATKSESEFQRSLGFAALAIAGKSDIAWQFAVKDDSTLVDWLNSISIIPNPDIRSGTRDYVLGLLGNRNSMMVREAAISALKFIPASQNDTFKRLSNLIEFRRLRPSVIQTLLEIPAADRDRAVSQQMVEFLVGLAENTPAAERTEDSFLDMTQLVDQLLVSVPREESKQYRNRLNEVSVRVVKIQTVEDEMRYDTSYFAVEAGRPVQVLLENHDLSAHNLVVTKAGKLKEVAVNGGAAGPGKGYLPDNREDILFATPMIQSNQQTRLTFEAPSEPGEYPYVCTFPQHWSRMYGVMVVVDDLDAWAKNPVKPKDPIGNNRSFVQKWTVDDLAIDIESGLRGRSMEIGAKIFKDATCLQCHAVGGAGGTVGPALDEVYARHKGDRIAVLREILDPSHLIDEKYSMHTFLTIDGLSITGIVQSENDDEVKLLDNPESKELTTVLVEDIEDRVRSSKSIMPKALLDKFSKDEIFELMSYVENVQKK